MAHRYCMGIDFGTLSARALIVDAETGAELASAVCEYAHGVMDERLPKDVCTQNGAYALSGRPLPPEWALQYPQDYTDCILEIIPRVLREAGLQAKDVIGIGVDFTSSTVMPVNAKGVPLCLLDAYRDEPHAYPMLWKHHAAQREADIMTETAIRRSEGFLAQYGGKVSSEWMLPKIWQTLNEAPEIYADAASFIEAGDWLVAQLTGDFTVRSGCMAGYKAFWNERDGYPSKEYLAALDSRLANLAEDKLSGRLLTIGSQAGCVTQKAAERFGLAEGIPVAVANIDAHVSLPALGITEPGKLLMIMGTSNCFIMAGERHETSLSDAYSTENTVPGMCGVVDDGVIPGLPGFEAGQTCVGDCYNWFVENCVPDDYKREADLQGIDLHTLLTGKAQQLLPGQSGLIALDWWNGNRSVLVNANLSGLMIGLTLATKPEEIYRALVESTAYGARMIMDTLTGNGVSIDSVYACGGIAQKNAFVMQIFADVLGREIRISRSTQAPALGSAMFGSVAAGASNGGYDSIADAAKAMGGLRDIVYRPILGNVAVYNQLFAEYTKLHDYFGRGGNDVMKRLKDIKRAVKG